MQNNIMKVSGWFQKELGNVKNGLCPFCDTPTNQKSFKDKLSLKEFQISGMCQSCMDKIFCD